MIVCNLEDISIEEDCVLGRGWLVCLRPCGVAIISCSTYDEALVARDFLSNLPRKLREIGMSVQ